MLRALWLLAILALFAAPAAGQQAEPADPDPVLVSMGTASVTGVYFPVGVALCRLVNQHRRDTGLRCAARPTDGSVANIAGLRDGSLELAIVQSDTQAQAAAGTAGFAGAGPFDSLRAVMALHPEPLTLVARADAGVAGVEDLAGKRVWLGPEGSGTRALAGDLMAALGWTDASFAPVPQVGADRLADALCLGEIDAFLYAIGHPALAIQEATTACDARLVPVAGPAIDELVDTRPDLLATTIPGGLYRGNPGLVSSFGVGATLVTRADQPDDRINAMVGQIFADVDTLRGLEPVLAALEPEAMASDGLTAPLHPGAAAYYRDRGWLE
jgi:TRAP transporter TAXI family solute receptor